MRLMLTTLALVFVALTFPRHAEPNPPAYTLLTKQIMPLEQPDVFESTSHFLDLFDLNSLDLVVLSASQADIGQVLGELQLRNGKTLEAADVVTLWTYSASASQQGGTIPNVTGLSVVSVAQNDAVTHHYFEKVGTRYKELPDYTATFSGPYAFSLMRVLHFASSSTGQDLPTNSTIYAIENASAPAFPQGFWDEAVDNSLLLVALQDIDRSAGVVTLGWFTDAFCEDVLGYTPGEHRCGNIKKCPVSQRQHCTGSPQYDCYGQDILCMAGEIEETSEGSILPNYDLLWDFRDSFLADYPRGLAYRNYYYVFSQFAKMDPQALIQYALVLPAMYQAVAVLMAGQDEDVVITADLYDKAMAVIDHHSDSGNLLLEETLQDVSTDLTAYYGLTRAQFIANFSQE